MLGRFARFELLQWRSDFGPFCLDCEGFFGARVWVWVFIFFGDEAFFFWVGCVRLGMENHFFVEAKSSFSVEIGKLKLQPEERRKGFAGVVSLGPRCEAWLIETVEEVLQSIGAEGKQQGREFFGGGRSSCGMSNRVHFVAGRS
jgi:hypothetical protein